MTPSYLDFIFSKSSFLMSENEFTSSDRVFGFKNFYELHIEALNKPQKF